MNGAPLESHIQADIRKAIGLLPRVRMWRNNVGTLFDAQGKPVKYGLANPGGSDLIGVTQVTITPEMVGRTLAVFTAGEVKRPGIRVPAHQQHFVDFVNGFGGLADVWRSPEDALRTVARTPGGS